MLAACDRAQKSELRMLQEDGLKEADA